MKKIINIDLSTYNSINEIHNMLVRELYFPKYYGMNLDALYDMLSSLSVQTVIQIYSTNKTCTFYDTSKLIQVLKDSSKMNPSLQVIEK